MGKEELSDTMKKIRVANTKRAKSQTNNANSHTRYLKSVIETPVQDFVSGDKELVIQSTSQNTFFISYGLLYVCQIRMEATDTTAFITITGDPSYFYSYSVSIDEMKKDVIKQQVRDALLDWYKSCFS